MKKFLVVFISILALLLMLSGCEMHEHTFADEWSTNEDYHWHACTAVENCNEAQDKQEHDVEVTADKDGKPINRCKVCQYENDMVSTAPEHEHVFDEKYATSSDFHWYPCTVDGCFEMKDRAEHAYSNPEITYSDKKIIIKYTCVDCLYEKVEEQEIKSEVDDAVSWNEAFKNFKLTNFSMDVNFVYGEGGKHTNHCVVTENEAYYCIPDSQEFYTVPNGDGTYTTYIRNRSTDKFIKLNDTSNTYLLGAQVETVIQVSFEDNFEKFTYDAETASYLCEEAIAADYFDFDGDKIGTMYCYNNIVKIADGKISYIEASYYFEESDMGTMSFKYYNIGMSAVEVPQSVIDEAVPEGNN